MIDLPAFTALLESYSTRERSLIESGDPQGDGAFEQRERIQAAARFVCEQGVLGDLVEIGVLHGSTTVLLAQVAREHGRRVLAIDPFEPGSQNCSGAEYPIFEKTIEPYADVIDFLRMRSDDPQAIAELGRREIALAFVDGLHEFSVTLQDLRTVSHARVIALDDTRAILEVYDALMDFADSRKHRNRKLYASDYRRETWII